MAIGDTVQAGLMRVNTQPITMAGRARGNTFRGIGNKIGQTIEQYQLNKEKRQAEEDTAIGTILGMQKNDQQSLSALMQNKNFSKAVESVNKGEGTSKQVDLINSSTAAYRTQQMVGMQKAGQDFKNAFTKSQTELLKLQAEFEKRTMYDKVQQEHTKSYGLELANEADYLQNEEAKIKSNEDRAEFLMKKKEHELKIKTYQNALEKDEGLLKLFNDTYDEQVKQAELETKDMKKNIGSKEIEDKLTEESTKLRKEQRKTLQAERKSEDVPQRPKITSKMEDEVSTYYVDTRDTTTGLLSDPDLINILGTGLEDDDLSQLKLNPAYEKMLLDQGRGDIRVLKLSTALQAIKDPLATPTQKKQAKEFVKQYQK